MAKYYKKYRHGGKSVPGMYKAQEGNGEGTDTTGVSQQNKVRDMVSNMINQIKQSRSDSAKFKINPINQEHLNAIPAMNAKNRYDSLQNEYSKMQMNQVIQNLTTQNQVLKEQNELLKTQNKKTDLINSARKVKKENLGAGNSPKRYGGKMRRGGQKR